MKRLVLLIAEVEAKGANDNWTQNKLDRFRGAVADSLKEYGITIARATISDVRRFDTKSMPNPRADSFTNIQTIEGEL